MMETKKREQYFYLDVLRALASFAVVVMHCTDRVFIVENDMHWWVSMVLQALAHWAIPAFFMLTGITLLNYRERYSTKDFFKKRVGKVLVPFFIWSGIYLVWNVFLGTIMLDSPLKIAQLMANNEINGVFWFFYVLFGLYLCIPILSILAEQKKVSVMYFFVLIWLVNVVVLPMVDRFTPIVVLQGTGGVTIGVAVGYVGYLILGWLLHHVDIKKRIRYIIYVLGVMGFLWMIVGTYWVNGKVVEGFDDIFMGFMSFDCILWSVSVVVFLKYVPWEHVMKPDGKARKCVQALAKASFGVYLLHMLVLQVMERLIVIDPFSYRHMTLGAVVLYAICVGITLIGQKVPGVRWLFP